MLPDTAIEFPRSVAVVPHDGADPHFPPTFLPTHQYLSLRTAGVWPDAGWGVDPDRQAMAWL
ncbi:hypothetical protein AB0L59_07410 [Streptomyces sp. NPDC052109]|uniref:hypothetical protein n=1 Tax=Streptomyces sp. NPDC052109 TaxID=3155527 RepID=UPI00342D4801